MDVVIGPNFNVMQELGIQFRKKGRKYRWNKYCNVLEVPEGKLIWNGMVRSLVMIRNIEYKNAFSEDRCDYASFLMENYFIVPEEFDEKSFVDQYRLKRRPIITNNYLDTPKSYTILTTTKCNARCFYCYERTSKHKKHMDEETAEKVASYIIRNDIGNFVSVGWFGGEPMFNQEIIELICNRLNAAGVNYNSSFVSNAYLFDEETIRKAKYEWKTNNIQITLDGTEDVYNKAKNYTNIKDGSPFKKVIQNIKTFLDYDISVSIRLNCDLYNIKDLKNLVEFLHNEIGEHDLFSVYAFQIFEEEGKERTPEEREELFKGIIEINELCEKYNMGIYKNLHMDIKSIHCLVDSGDGIIIDPNGNFGVCEHYIDSGFFGHIDDPNTKNFEILKEWRNYTEAEDICQDCSIYPSCLRVKKCTDEKVCYKEEQPLELFKEHSAIRAEWQRYLRGSNQNKQCDNNNCCKEHS